VSNNKALQHDSCLIVYLENQVARAEAMLIANTDNQYLVPTSGKPLRGLIQDHVVAGVWMTARDTFFSREEYFQLLYGALRPEGSSGHHSSRLLTLPPTIWKPKALWTGKQIVSAEIGAIGYDSNLVADFYYHAEHHSK
jgi:DNA-directed RNA polymerase beta' subunit